MGGGRLQGFGSFLHTATIHLAVAMQHGRLFLWLPVRARPVPEDRQWWTGSRLNDHVRVGVQFPPQPIRDPTFRDQPGIPSSWDGMG